MKLLAVKLNHNREEVSHWLSEMNYNKASMEILEAYYHKVHRNGEERYLLCSEWITTTDYKLPEKSVFYLIFWGRV